jgi:hypothetical protein
MPSRDARSLCWVVSAGELTPISTFAAVPPSRRPTVFCPECGQRLILKLGRIRVHHAAHHPDDAECPAAHPETALHINTKCYLAAVLTSALGHGAPLRAGLTCAWGRPRESKADFRSRPDLNAGPCEASLDQVLADRWDAVFLEHRIGQRSDESGVTIPDIILKRDGTPVAAVEVFVRHRVDEEKSARLAAMGIPWIEVRGSVDLYDGAHPWTIDLPLPAFRLESCEPWMCTQHMEEHLAWREDWLAARAREKRDQELWETLRQERRKRRRSEAETVGPDNRIVRAVRVVDSYKPDGTSRRRLYRVVEFTENGGPVALYLEEEGVLGRWPFPDTDVEKKRVWAEIQTTWRADVRTLQQRERSFVDTRMAWAKGVLAGVICIMVRSALPEDRAILRAAFPPRYERVGAYWVARADEWKPELCDAVAV